MESSKQLVDDINTLSEDDKKLLIELINRIKVKNENFATSVLAECRTITKDMEIANFPIRNAKLMEESDYLKKLYFQCLAIALTVESNSNHGSLYLFNRLLSGIEIEGDVEFYLKKAYTMEKEQLYVFLDEIASKELKFRFIIVL